MSSANKAYDELLKLIDPTSIKFMDEQITDYGKELIANVLLYGNEDFINSIANDPNYKNTSDLPDHKDYLQYTDFGYIEIVVRDDRIIITINDENGNDESNDNNELLMDNWQDNWQEPKIGKRIKSYKGFKIYLGTNQYGDENYTCFLPGDTPAIADPEWESENLQEIIDFIDSYDLDESAKIKIEQSFRKIESTSFTEENIYDTLDDIIYVCENYDNAKNDSNFEQLKKVISTIEEFTNNLKNIIDTGIV